MRYLFLDTETTSLNEGRIIQIAYRLRNEEGEGTDYESLYKPEVAISFGAMGVCRITPEMIEDKIPFQLDNQKEKLEAIYEDSIFIAHNAPFDIDVLAREGVKAPSKMIDTYKVAYYFFEGQENWKLQTLLFSLGLYKQFDEMPKAHDAMGDVLALEKLFDLCVERGIEIAREGKKDLNNVLSRMMNLSSVPLILREIPWGDHKGKKFFDVLTNNPKEFDWFYTKQKALPIEEQNENMLYTLEHYYEKLDYQPRVPQNIPKEGEVQVKVVGTDGYKDYLVAVNLDKSIMTLHNGDVIYEARTSTGKTMKIKKSGGKFYNYFVKR